MLRFSVGILGGFALSPRRAEEVGGREDARAASAGGPLPAPGAQPSSLAKKQQAGRCTEPAYTSAG